MNLYDGFSVGILDTINISNELSLNTSGLCKDNKPDPQNFCDCSILRDVIVSDVNTANYDYSLTNYLYSDNGKDYISWCKDTIRSDTEYYRYNCTTKSVNNCNNTKYCKITNLQPPKNLNLDKKKEINLSKLDLDPNNTVLYIGYVSDDSSTTWDKNINSQPWNHLVEDENILTVLNDLYNNGYIIHIKVYKSSDNNYNIIFDIESSIIGKVIHWRFYNEYNEVLGNISSIKDTITYNITYNNPDSNIVDHIEIIELK